MNDLVAHFLVGFAMAGFGPTPYLQQTPEYGLALAVAIGAGKEQWDKKAGGKFDKKDLLATVAGGFTMYVIRVKF